MNQQLEESEQRIADFGKQNTKPEEQLSAMRSQVQEKDGGAKARVMDRTNLKLRWREGEKAPNIEMLRYCDAVVNNSTVYCRCEHKHYVYCAYHIPSSTWSPIADWGPQREFAFAVIDGLVTGVGGLAGDAINHKETNKLFSLTGEGSGRQWTEKFPPMPTKRSNVSALCTGTVLIVAGGTDENNQKLKTVEVMNVKTGRWHTAPDLPEPLSASSLTLCGDLLYLLGGFNNYGKSYINYSVYSCSLSSLPLSIGSKSLQEHLSTQSSKDSPWNRVADLPVSLSTAVSLHGQLLAIGGVDSEDKPSAAVRMYQPTTNSWEIISHMKTPRAFCLSAVLPDNQLMVMGGTTDDNNCYSVEFGTII